jgi:hypothetical protein
MGSETTREDLLAGIDAAEARLGPLASRPLPPMLTEPDPTTEERWEPAQVWAHVSELIPYWLGEARRMASAMGQDPVPYGRLSTDAIRVDAIEERRGWSQAQRWQGIRDDLEALRHFIRDLPAAEFGAQGLHPTGAVRTVGYVLERSIVAHVGEHAEQLERLASAAEAVVEEAPEAFGE